eukprot:TRINITY_DN4271_c2_g2_i1.p1 TRINITY_DN4271_c2_g2~~TRINITY_DN4271_c2_g2_i1.p1  ORF type:complete len:114 (+),score=30.93 TRINITY_DN4271_c2_g2_i1:140-481(+)
MQAPHEQFYPKPIKPEEDAPGYKVRQYNSQLEQYKRSQRVYERHIAIQEFRDVSRELELCVLHHTVNSRRKCQHLTQEYVRRTKFTDMLPSENDKDISVVRTHIFSPEWNGED